MSTFKAVFGIDLRTLALFRVCIGLLLIADLIIRAGHLTAHYTDFGVFPRAVALEYLSRWRISIHLANGSNDFQILLFVIAGAFALLLILGYRTRIVTVVSWLLLMSLQNRNPLVLHAADNLLALLLFWSMFLPLSARFSVDAALDSQTKEVPNRYFSVGTMAILIQAMSVYFFSVFLKSSPVWIPDGTAIYYALHAEGWATPLAEWFRQFDLAMRGLTYFVWSLEFIGPLLMFSPIWHVPLRFLFMFLFISMHIAFILFLHIGLFPYISITSLLLFTPSWVWERIGARLRSPERLGVRMYYDADCGFCRKTCLLLRTFLLLPETPIVPAQEDADIYRTMVEHDSWVVIDHDGTRYVRWRAVALVYRRSFLFWPLGVLFDWAPLRSLGDRIYGFVARNRRGFLGSLSAILLPYRPVGIAPTRLASVAVAVLTLLTLCRNVVTLPQVPYDFPSKLDSIVRTLRLDQKWRMFAPSPIQVTGWFVIPGELRDGTQVDVFNRVEGKPSSEKPRSVWPYYKDFRWRKYLQRLIVYRFERDEEQLLYFGRYLCRSWNQRAPREKKLVTFQIHYYSMRTLLDHQVPEVKDTVLWYHHCFAPQPAVEDSRLDADD